MTFDQKNLAIGPMYLCHGAEGEFAHTFKIEGVIDSPWLDQHVSINHAPGFSSAVVADPRYGELQEFPSMGAKWQLSCPGDGKDADFEYWVKSEFTAEPYSIPVRLGDYRRKILSSRAPISAPIINDEVVAEVTIGSFYTDKKLEGVEVQWWVDGEHIRPELTSNLGVSTFKHAFVTAGIHTVVAKIHSPYNEETVEQKFEVNVYADSPWKGAELTVNGLEVLWNAPIVLFRGQKNELKVKAPANIANNLKLKVVNDEGLTIQAKPDFDTWAPGANGEVVWELTLGADKSGRIILMVSSEETIQSWDLACWVTPSLVNDFTLLFDGKPLADSPKALLTRYGLHTLTLMPKGGGPVVNDEIMLEWGIPPTGLGLEMTPDVRVAQTVHPTDGATWTLRCLDVDGDFSVKAAFTELPGTPWDVPMSVAAGAYQLTFLLISVPQPYPPAVTPAIGLGGTWPAIAPKVKVTTHEGTPVEGVNVVFISPEYPDGSGITAANGQASSTQGVKYFKEGIVELIVRTTEVEGRVSMMRLLVNHIEASSPD
jgi:hypothetical protein